MNLLRDCLASLRRQTLPPVEIIVVDNASTDSSRDMVAREFPGVHLLALDSNHGFCAANNRAIALAHGDFVALLNNDATADPGWLAALAAATAANPRVGMVASKILVAGRPGIIDKVGHGIYLDGQNRGRGSGEPDHGQYDHLSDVLWPDGCAALYRRDMLSQIGGFEESFFAYADDAELGLRARSAGWLTRFAPQAIVHHHRGATLGKYNPARIRLIERNRLWLAIIHFPLWLLLLNPFFFSLRLLAGALAALAGQGEASQVAGFPAKFQLLLTLLAADLEALRGLGPIWRKRRAWRARRSWSDSEVFQLLWQHRLSLSELSRNLA
jgi:GT2 family glycosyltransferase